MTMLEDFPRFLYPGGDSSAPPGSLAAAGRSWASLYPRIKGLTEADLAGLFRAEAAGRRRPIILSRTLARLRVLRARRENDDLRAVLGDDLMDRVENIRRQRAPRA